MAEVTETEPRAAGARRFKFEKSAWSEPPARLRRVELVLKIFDDRIEGSETLFFEAREALRSVRLDAQDLETGPVAFASGWDAAPGVPCAALLDKPGRALYVALPSPVGAGAKFALALSAVCRPTQNVLDGAYWDVAPAGAPPQLMSQCQQWGFQRIMPIVDDCTAKCTWRTTLEGSARYTHLVSNGDVDRTACPDGRPVPLPGDPSRVRIVYRNDIPMPPYLFLVAAGTWDCLADEVALPSGRVVRLEYLVPPGKKDGARVPMEILKRSAVFQARHTGCEYARECYRTICMEKSNFGGMENVGNTTIITEAALLDEWTADRRLFYAHGVIVHEFEHNHCGSGVTMRTPFDMWLNEAYTVTVERAFLRESFGDTICRLDELDGLRDRLRGPLAAEDGGASFPVVRDGFDSPDDVVDGVTYDKAPEILGMLRALVGAEAYDRAMAGYFRRHEGGNVETADLLAAFGVRAAEGTEGTKGTERTEGTFGLAAPRERLARFFREWLFTTGHPRVRASWRWDRASARLGISLSQTRAPRPAVAAGAPLAEGAGGPFVVPIRVRAVDASGAPIPGADRLLVLETEKAEFAIDGVAEEPAFVDFGSDEPFYGTFSDDSATPAALALAASVSPFPVGRVEAFRALARRAAAGDAASRDALFEAMSAALGDSALDPAVRAALLAVSETDLSSAPLPAGPARARAARSLLREGASRLGFDRLSAALAAVPDAPPPPAASGIDPLSAGIPRRALRRSLLALAALADGERAVPLLRAAFDGATCVGSRLAAASAAVEAGLPCAAELLGRLRGLCAGHVGAYAAYLSLVGSDPDPGRLFAAVAEAEADPSFREEHPGHSRSLYAAVSRNAEALWTERGLAWFRAKLAHMAAVNENVAIVMLGAVQDWRELPEDLRESAETLLRGALAEIRASAPAAESLAARIGDLLA